MPYFKEILYKHHYNPPSTNEFPDCQGKDNYMLERRAITYVITEDRPTTISEC